MNRECYEYAKDCGRRGGIWKLISAILFIALAATAVSAFILKIKNKEYRDLLIEDSERFEATPEQEEEMAEIRRREWGRAHSMANKKTIEERLEDNRITEEA